MVKVCDAFMGAGKTSAAINYMRQNPDKRFIYITPYYDETERVRDACPDLHFRLPSNRLEEYGFAKRSHFKELVKQGRNIAITHALFKLCDRDTTNEIIKMGYCIFIDEALDIFHKMEVSKNDLALIIDSGWLSVEENEAGGYEYYYDIDSAQNKYQNGRFMDLFVYAASQRLTKIPSVDGGDDDNIWYWTLDSKLFEAGLDIFILTFMFEGSVMHSFLQANKIDIEYIGVKKNCLCSSDGGAVYEFADRPQCPPEYVGHLSEMIQVLDDKKMNEIGEKPYALSHNWFSSRANNDRKKDLLTLRNNVYNFFRHKNQNSKANQRLWSTYKTMASKLKGKGYSNSFLSYSIKATNDYRECCVLAYLVNIFYDPNVKVYLASRGAQICDNNYALSTMVQWIWRSAIRDGKSINIYIPSKRMREMLLKWIDESEERYWAFKATENNERGSK